MLGIQVRTWTGTNIVNLPFSNRNITVTPKFLVYLFKFICYSMKTSSRHIVYEDFIVFHFLRTSSCPTVWWLRSVPSYHVYALSHFMMTSFCPTFYVDFILSRCRMTSYCPIFWWLRSVSSSNDFILPYSLWRLRLVPFPMMTSSCPIVWWLHSVPLSILIEFCPIFYDDFILSHCQVSSFGPTFNVDLVLSYFLWGLHPVSLLDDLVLSHWLMTCLSQCLCRLRTVLFSISALSCLIVWWHRPVPLDVGLVLSHFLSGIQPVPLPVDFVLSHSLLGLYISHCLRSFNIPVDTLSVPCPLLIPVLSKQRTASIKWITRDYTCQTNYWKIFSYINRPLLLFYISYSQ